MLQEPAIFMLVCSCDLLWLILLPFIILYRESVGPEPQGSSIPLCSFQQDSPLSGWGFVLWFLCCLGPESPTSTHPGSCPGIGILYTAAKSLQNNEQPHCRESSILNMRLDCDAAATSGPFFQPSATAGSKQERAC